MSSALTEPLLHDQNTVENTRNSIRYHRNGGVPDDYHASPDLPSDTDEPEIKPKSININVLHTPDARPPPFSPQFSRERRGTELQVPECVKLIKSRSNKEFEGNWNTISLSRDIFMSIAVLKAYRIWQDLPVRHRRQLLILAFICICVQFGLLLTLTIEMIIHPPWEADDLVFYADNGELEGKTMLGIVTKFWCLVAVLIYLFKELEELKAYRKLRLEIMDFKQTCSKFLFGIYNLYNLCLFILAMALSVVLISTSINGFDAVLNAVAILFVLEIDNWMYSLIKSNQYVEDIFFDIKYEKHKEVTSYIIAKYQYMSNCCSCCKCQISSYLHKAEGDETFISLISLFVWFAMIMSFALITLGQLYDEPDFTFIGFIALSVVCSYYVFRYGFGLIIGCFFKYRNKNKINDFSTEQLPRMIHVYVKKMDKAKQGKQSNQSKNWIRFKNKGRICRRMFQVF